MKLSRRLLLAAMMLLGAEATAGASAPARKTLTRFHDPVVIGTSVLAELADHATAHYRLYAAHKGVIEPIPFQFDARDDGDLVFPATPAEAEFTFDDDDELVFMAKDTGDRVARTELPPASDAALELEVTDPVDGGQGWAYLVHFPDHPPPRSPVTYATFDAEKNTASAQLYRITYFPGRNFFTELRITPAGGGTGENLLNRMRVRINPTFSLLLTTWSPVFTEESFSVTIDGIKNGPVRAVRRVRQSLDLGKFFPEVPSGTVYTHAAGFSLLGMTNLREPGAYQMNLGVFILPRRYAPGDEVQPLAMLREPLRVQVAPVGGSHG